MSVSWLYIDGEEIGYLALELTADLVNLHLHIKKEYRTRDNIMVLKDLFEDKVKPMVRAWGYSGIVVNCDYNDMKTKGLFETFGFKPAAIWVAVQEV